MAVDNTSVPTGTMGGPVLGNNSGSKFDMTKVPFCQSHVINVTLHKSPIAKYRIIRAKDRIPGFPNDTMLLLMALHSPSTGNESYRVLPIWVALRQGNNISMFGDTPVENYTSLRMAKLVARATNKFNSANVTGFSNVVNVPTLRWDYDRDNNLAEEQLLEDKLVEVSNVIMVNDDALSPIMSFDDGKTCEKPDNFDDDYGKVCVDPRLMSNGPFMINGEESKGPFRLRPHPIMNSVAGYVAIKLDDNDHELYPEGHTRFGLHNTRGNSRNKLYTCVGLSFRNIRDTNPSYNIIDIQDNVTGNDSSRATAFAVSLSKTGYNEVAFTGSLRLSRVGNSLASAFRFYLNSWLVLNNVQADYSSSQDDFADRDFAQEVVMDDAAAFSSGEGFSEAPIEAEDSSIPEASETDEFNDASTSDESIVPAVNIMPEVPFDEDEVQAG